jgi:peptidoglycan/LPS O-acetylase OafA/YrhL
MGYAAPLDLTESREVARAEPSVGESKLLGLELLRFICAFAVLLWHYQHFYRISGAPAFVASTQPWHAPFAPFYDYGLFGVQFFWGISGFIFFWKYGQAIFEGTVGGAKFFWLRFSRLYPLHLATLLLVALLQPTHIALAGTPFIYQGNDVPAFAAQLAMATHWFGPQPFTFNGPIWSVSAEIFVYALFFLLVRRFGSGWRLIGGSIAVTLAAISAGMASPTLFCATYFFVGGAAARLFLDAQSSRKTLAQRWICAVALAVIGGGVWSAGTPLNEDTMPLILLLVLPPLLLLAAQDWSRLERWQRLIQAAGNLTYSSYLSHFPLQLLVAIGCAAAGLAPPVQSPAFLIAYLAFTFVVSRWLFLRFERPAQKWIRKLSTRRIPVRV